MKNKKKAAKIFTFLLCMSLLAGCSDNSGSGSSTTVPTQATEKNDTGSNNNSEGQDKDDKTDDGSKSSDNGSSDVKSGDGGNDKSGQTGDGGATGNDGSNDEKKSEDGGESGNGSSGTGDDSGNEGKKDDESTSFSVPVSASYKPFNIEYKNKDLETSYVPGDCTSIVFSDNDVKVVGKETEISNVNGRQTVKIIKKGDYIISGSCSNGQIIVDANKEKDVRLILNDLNLTCTDSAPIYEKQCDKMVITLAEGTENVLSDTSEYKYEDTEKKQPDSVIFAKDDLVINGSGTLKVNSVYSEGIHSTDSVKLVSGNIIVNSGDNGVRGKEGVIIKEAKLSVTSKGDSIKTTYSDNTSLGYVIIEGGNIELHSAKDGIQATGHIQITGGNINITIDNGYAHAGDSEEDSKSTKGIKGDNDLYISGASVTVVSTDDAINNNGNVIIDGGTVVLKAMDDAIHADGNIVINGGDVNVEESVTVMDALSVSINGGNVNLIGEERGILASGEKEDDSDDKVRFGLDDPFAVNESVYIALTGGTVYICAEGNCLRSKGNLYVTGGKITLDGDMVHDGEPVSLDGSVFVSGGTIELSGEGDITSKIASWKS